MESSTARVALVSQIQHTVSPFHRPLISDETQPLSCRLSTCTPGEYRGQRARKCRGCAHLSDCVSMDHGWAPRPLEKFSPGPWLWPSLTVSWERRLPLLGLSEPFLPSGWSCSRFAMMAHPARLPHRRRGEEAVATEVHSSGGRELD